MSDPRDEKLERLLRSRRIEPANLDLTQRIVQSAAQRPQNRSVPFWPWLRDLFGEFHLPKPAYVLAGALLLGMMIGFNTPETNPAADDGSAVQSFLSADEAFL